MLSSTPRTALRSTRALRATRFARRPNTHARFESSATEKASAAASNAPNSSSGIIGGVVGGSLVFLAGYGYYHFSGAKTFVNTAHQTKAYFDKAFKKSAEKVPEPNQAIEWLRETVSSYTKMIPGASQYVDTAFDDLDKIRESHGKEVDDIVRQTYDEMKEVTKAGVSFAAAAQAWDVLQKCLARLGKVAGGATDEILKNHPQLKEQFGGKFSQLKQMGDSFGPEAKKQVDETWDQVKDILKGGFSADTAMKVQNLIQEKSEAVKKFGDQAWQKGIEQAKPLLDKQPELKEMVEKNKDKLLQGDLGQLWSKIQEAIKSGKTDDVQDFVKQQVEKASSSGGGGGGGGFSQLFSMIPGGDEIGPKLQQLQELSQKHGKEAEKLVKSAVDDIKSVLAKKVEEGQALKDKAAKDVKS